MKGTLYMDYALWLLSDDAGRITLTGWAESGAEGDATAAETRTDHWPTYLLCEDRTALSARLQELGLDLAPGADLNDLARGWDVYVRHPDIKVLRASLDARRSSR